MVQDDSYYFDSNMSHFDYDMILLVENKYVRLIDWFGLYYCEYGNEVVWLSVAPCGEE